MICWIESRTLQRKEVRDWNTFNSNLLACENVCSSNTVPEIFTPITAGRSRMLGSVETLVGRLVESLKGLRRDLGRQKPLKTD